MKSESTFLRIMPSGYGHKRLTIHLDGVEYSTVTNHMYMTDRINRDDNEDEDSNLAKIEAVKLVLDDNGFNYNSVVIEHSFRYGNHIVVYWEEEQS